MHPKITVHPSPPKNWTVLTYSPVISELRNWKDQLLAQDCQESAPRRAELCTRYLRIIFNDGLSWQKFEIREKEYLWMWVCNHTNLKVFDGRESKFKTHTHATLMSSVLFGCCVGGPFGSSCVFFCFPCLKFWRYQTKRSHGTNFDYFWYATILSRACTAKRPRSQRAKLSRKYSQTNACETHSISLTLLCHESLLVDHHSQGASQTILRVTLVDLQETYQTTTQKISAVLTCRWESRLPKCHKVYPNFFSERYLLNLNVMNGHLLKLTLHKCHNWSFKILTIQVSFCILRYAALVVGSLIAGKVYQKLNQHLLFATVLFLMGTCVFVAPSCGNLWSFLITMALHGFFDGFLAVGKIDQNPELFFML